MKEYRITHDELTKLANFIGQLVMPWVKTDPMMTIVKDALRRPIPSIGIVTVDTPPEGSALPSWQGSGAPEPVK